MDRTVLSLQLEKQQLPGEIKGRDGLSASKLHGSDKRGKQEGGREWVGQSDPLGCYWAGLLVGLRGEKGLAARSAETEREGGGLAWAGGKGEGSFPFYLMHVYIYLQFQNKLQTYYSNQKLICSGMNAIQQCCSYT